MLRRLIKLLLAHKRSDSRYWRQLYHRERAARQADGVAAEQRYDAAQQAWNLERLDLLNRLLMKNAIAPVMQPEQEPFKSEQVLSEEEQEAQAIAEQGHALAHSAAFDDFQYESLQLAAQNDPIWRPVAAEARQIREGGGRTN